MAVRVAAALEAAGATTVTALGGDVAALRAAGLTSLADRKPGEGPLAAIVHALDVAGEAAAVVVLACDLVRPDAAAIETVVSALAAADADLAVPVVDGRPQWLHAVWNRRVSGVLAALHGAGERSVAGAVGGLRVLHVDGLDARFTVDADTPDDLPPDADTRA